MLTREEKLGILPFLSPVAATLTLCELIKLSQFQSQDDEIEPGSAIDKLDGSTRIAPFEHSITKPNGNNEVEPSV